MPLPDIESDLSNTFLIGDVSFSPLELVEFDPTEGMPYALPFEGTDGDNLIEIPHELRADGILGATTDGLAGDDTITGLLGDAEDRSVGEVSGG